MYSSAQATYVNSMRFRKAIEIPKNQEANVLRTRRKRWHWN